MFHLTGRVVSTVCIIVALCLGLGGYMSYSAARATYEDGVAGRMRMLAEQIAAAIEASQAMGIAVSEQTAIPALLQRESRNVPLLEGFVVRGPDRNVLFQMEGMTQAGDQLAASVVVRNDLGEPTAFVDAIYASLPIRAALVDLAWKIGLATLASAACAVAFACIGGFLLLRRLRRFAADPEAQVAESRAWIGLHQTHDRIERCLRGLERAG